MCRSFYVEQPTWHTPFVLVSINQWRFLFLRMWVFASCSVRVEHLHHLNCCIVRREIILLLLFLQLFNLSLLSPPYTSFTGCGLFIFSLLWWAQFYLNTLLPLQCTDQKSNNNSHLQWCRVLKVFNLVICHRGQEPVKVVSILHWGRVWQIGCCRVLSTWDNISWANEINLFFLFYCLNHNCACVWVSLVAVFWGKTGCWEMQNRRNGGKTRRICIH